MTQDDRRAATKAMWGLADYTGLAQRLEPAAAALVDAAAPLADSRVLDLAAGTGTVAAFAAQRGAHVTACDISPRMVELGRQATAAAGLTIDWHEANAEALPFADSSFDLVLS
ncbi:MAG: class I SAM-dependent methyltransferase, partial [Pseudonocardiaceae bacterium]